MKTSKGFVVILLLMVAVSVYAIFRAVDVKPTVEVADSENIRSTPENAAQLLPVIAPKQNTSLANEIEMADTIAPDLVRDTQEQMVEAETILDNTTELNEIANQQVLIDFYQQEGQRVDTEQMQRLQEHAARSEDDLVLPEVHDSMHNIDQPKLKKLQDDARLSEAGLVEDGSSEYAAPKTTAQQKHAADVEDNLAPYDD